GANYNASTSQETTCYWAHVLPKFLPRAIDLLSDMLRPSLRHEDFEVERKVILEEIGMYADRPFWIAYEQAMADHHGDHGLGHRILGTPGTIASMKAERMRHYFEQRYRPDNIVCALAGQVDVKACLRQIETACGSWPAGGSARSHEPVRRRYTRRTMRRPSVNMHYVVGIGPGPSDQDEDRHAAAVLSYVLGDSEGSRLYWKLIDPGLADEVELSHQGFDRTGSMMFYVSCPTENAEQVEAILDQELHSAAENLSDAEVQRAVSKMAMGLTLRGEKPLGRMMNLGGQWLALGRHLSLEEHLAHIEAVTCDDLRAVVEKYPLDRHARVRLGPGDADDGEAVNSDPG
ncbi:MAG: pitrilysin family protein, partial [Phycisphaeraceae bacterium]|nr:pitrilysin family protein [Phycisphaeraceae bacterium]